MTNYRIQLASNFQVIEFNLELDDENEMLTADDERIIDAVNCVNKLGEVVVNTIKTKNDKTETTTKITTEEMATEKQKELLKRFGFEDIDKFTKKEAAQAIKRFLEVNKG